MNLPGWVAVREPRGRPERLSKKKRYNLSHPGVHPACTTPARRERVTAHAGSRARLCMLDFWSGRTYAEAVAAVKCISRNGKASRGV